MVIISYVVDPGKEVPFLYPKAFNSNEKTFVTESVILSIFVLKVH